MRSALMRVVCSLAVVGLGLSLVLSPAAAEDVEFKQIKLTTEHVKGFISAQSDIEAISDRFETESEEAEEKLLAELDAIAKKNGFASFEELDDVAANISIVMAGIDPDTNEYSDPIEAIKKEMEDIKADDSIPADEKKQMLEEIQEALEMMPALEHPENIQMVKEHRAEIEKALE